MFEHFVAQLTGGITLFSSYIMFALSRFPFNTLFKVNAKPFNDFVVAVAVVVVAVVAVVVVVVVAVVAVVVVAVVAAVVVVTEVVGTHEH